MKILLIGKNSMVAKEFAKMYHSQYRIVEIGREENLEDIVSKEADFDVVIFLAQSGDYKSRHFTDDLYNANINLLYKSIKLLRSKTKQFIYFSTGSVYRVNETGNYTEDSPLDVVEPSPYAASKISGELIVSTVKQDIESVIILRPFYIYGKEQKPYMLFKSLHNKIINGEEITLNDNRGLVFNPIHSEDVAILLNHLIQNRKQGRNVYNVAGKETTNLKTVIDCIASYVETTPILKELKMAATTCIASVSIQGWAPKVSLREGIAKTFSLDGE